MSSWKRSGNVTTCAHSTQVDANAPSSGPKDETTRIRGWAGRPPAGYVTIGSIRYGVRFASNAPTTTMTLPTPTRGAAPSRAPLLSTSDASNHDADCCCGVVPLSWPRTGPSSPPPPPPPSRLPIPSTLGEKPQTIIRRNMFSRLNTGELSSRIVGSRVETVTPRAVPAPRSVPVSSVPAPPVQVYKSTLEWCSVRKTAPKGGGVRSCFSAGEEDTEPEDGGLKMVKERVVPSSPLRRRILVRSKPELPSYLKTCANSSTESLLLVQPDSDSARSTLDRLNRFRFGAGAASAAERKDAAVSRAKKKRSTDKTERLKELTEKLKSPSTSASASPERGVPDQEVGQASGGVGVGVVAPPRLGRLPTLERSAAATASKTHLPAHQQQHQQQQQQPPSSGVTTNPKFGRQPTCSIQSRNKYPPNIKQAESHKSHPPHEEQRRLTKQRHVVSPPLTSPDRSNYQQRIEENLRFQQELALQEEMQFAEEYGSLVTPFTRVGSAPDGSSVDPTPTPAPTPAPASVTCTVTVGGVDKDPATEVTTAAIEDESSDDLFFLHRPESRTIVGSYTQSKIPYRSASFSQVDYSQVDGKYVRNANRTSPYGGYTTAPSGSHTLPRKRLPDIESVSSSVSPSTSLSGVEQAAEPTPEEVYKVNVAKLVSAFSGDVVSKTRTCPTALFSRGDFSEEIPFTEPMEDEGLMFASSLPPTDVQEVAEETSTPAEEVATLASVTDNITRLAEETTKDEGVSALPEESVDHNAADIDDRTEVPSGDNVFSADVVNDDRTETVQDLSSPWLYALQHNDIGIAPSNSENYQSAEIEKQKQYPVIAKSTVVFQADIVSVDVFSDKSADNNPADNVISATEADELKQVSQGGSFIAEWPTGHDESSKPTPTPTPKPRRDDEIDYSKECVRQCEEWLKELGEDFQLQQKQNVRSVQVTGGDEEKHDDQEAKDSCPDTIQCLKEDDHEEYKVASITKVELQRSAPLQIERSETEKDKQPQIANEVAIITTPPQWTDDKRWSGEGTDSDRNNDWGSPSEEPQTPEEMGQRPQWPAAPETRRWPLVYQSSDERDDETTSLSRPSPKRYLTVRADSFSEGESEAGEIRPRTPTREERDRNTSPSLLTPTEEFDSRSGGIGIVHEARTVHVPRRYSKRPLRGPYGQMLEAEMKKPETSRIFSKVNYNDDLKVFLEEYRPTSPPPGTPTPDTLRPTSDSRLAPRRSLATHSLDDSQLKGGYGRSASVSVPATGARRSSPKRKVNASIPFPVLDPEDSGLLMACHQRTISSPSTLDGYSNVAPIGERLRPEPTPELLAELLRGSSERLSTSTSAINGNFLQDTRDTRTHVVVELYDTERNYVEALQILVMKYLQPLKSPENAGLVDASLVDEIFYQVPAILQHHEHLLDELRKRLDNWDINQKIGDVFLEAFTRQPVIETYTAFINNWKSAKEAIKATCQAKPAFARFIEAMAREHKGKLALDCLLIKPVQRIPRYELLIQRLLKHTDQSHPDHVLLLEAQKEVHELAVKINCTERESLEYEQQQNTLKELENIIEGSINLVSSERMFIRHDMVSMVSGQGTRKERALFLFSDLLVITSVKRRSGTIRKPSATCPGSVASTLEANKYKLLMRVPLDDLEIVKTKDENLKKRLREMEHLSEDIATLNQVTELCSALHCPHSQLEEIVKDMLNTASKQLEDQRTTDAQLSYLELTVNTQSGMDNISVVFTKAEKRNWEESFNEAKQKLADRRPSPEFVLSVPIRKTRAGLQFTCAAPTLGLNASNMRDVWVCNSDGYVGQVCVLSLTPEPTVISCNGVCNARILCVASVPAGITGPTAATTQGQPPFTSNKIGISISVEDTDKSGGNIQLDSSSSSSDDDEQDEERPPRIAPPEDEQKRARSASDSVLATDRDASTALPTAPPASQPDDTDSLQPTMWLGTEDGCIHVYNCTDNIRIKKNKVKIQHGSSVHCIIYLDNRVFVALANGDITVYIRDHSGWNTTDPYTVSVGTASMPVSRMLPVAGKLWCGCHNSIKILNTFSLEVEHSFVVNADMTRNVTWLATAGLGAWVSLHNSAIVRLFHATTYECLTEVNVAPAVNKMLASCDDIIRQHKAACLRVTSLLACKDLLWIGTSAGVVLTMSLPHIAPSTTKLAIAPSATGVPHGHTGHVRFLTVVDTLPSPAADGLVLRPNTHHRYSLKTKPDLVATAKLLVISGGDGYEDFRTSSASEVAGREDSTNHLLIWHV